MRSLTVDRVQQAFYLSLAIAVSSLVYLSITAGRWSLALATLALGLLWSWAHWRRRRGFASGGLAGLVGLAAIGVWLALPAGGLVLVAATALVSWDLDQFLARLSWTNAATIEAAYLRHHLIHLAAVVGSGLALGWLALEIRFTLEFGSLLLLGGVLFFSLAWLAAQAWPFFSGSDPKE